MAWLSNSIWKSINENHKVREFIIYTVFLTLFSIVTFASKPGEVQYYLNAYHTTSLSLGLETVTTTEDLYDWLAGPFAEKVFPIVNPANGRYLDEMDRLYISGDYSRIMGAIRVRQVRSQTRECAVPEFLKTVNGQNSSCARSYSSRSRQKTPIYSEESLMYEELNNINFTKPFTYRTPKQLNTTILYGQAGRFGIYGQDGFALDALPNIAPKELAFYVSECRPAMVAAINRCRSEQGMAPYEAGAAAAGGVSPAAAAPTATSAIPLRRRLMQGPVSADPIAPLAGVASSCTEDDPIEEMLQGVDTSRCQLLSAPETACRLHDVGFDLMRQLFNTASEKSAQDADLVACRGCKCQGNLNPVCVQSCSPKKLFRNQVATLRKSNWIDEETTRAVMVDCALFNQNFNLFTSFRALFEMPTIGGVQSQPFTRTFRIHRYVSTWDAVILGLEIVFLAFIVFYTLQELREIMKLRFAYFKDVWNLLDWANLLILYIVIGLRISALLLAQSFTFSASTIAYIDFVPMGAFATQELNIGALNFFLLYFKVFKYLRHVPRMDAILVTISGAALDLLLFIIMAGIVLIGFSAAFYVCFGMSVAEYRSFGNSFGSLIQALLGVFDYKALEKANRVMAPLLFYLYFAVVFFVLLSMFIAILDDSYGVVKSNQSDDDLNYYKNLYKQAVARFTGVLGKKAATQNLVQDLLNADSGETLDGLLDETELNAVLAKNPKALKLLRTTNVKALIEKHDINQDGMLDRSELMEMIDKLLAEASSLEDNVKSAQGEDGGPPLPEGVAELQSSIGGVQDKVVRVDGAIRDLSRNTAKKLGLMIDLMMSLSDQIQTTGRVLPGMIPGGSSAMLPAPGGAGGYVGM